MKRRSTHVFVLAILFTGVAQELAAQTRQESSPSKTITQTIPLSSTEILKVVAEKANVRVTGWAKQQVQIKITMLAEHSDHKIATQELSYMNYALDREGEVVELRNAFLLPANIDHIQSKLTFSFDLMVPAGNPFILRAKYGDVIIRGLKGKSEATLEFTDVELDQMEGSLKLKSTFSEVRGQNLSINVFECNDSRSALILDLSGGKYTFESSYSDIDLSLKDATVVTIKGVHTPVTLHSARFENYVYDLLSKEGKIFLPVDYASKLAKDGKQASFKSVPTTQKPLIKIQTSYNAITIK